VVLVEVQDGKAAVYGGPLLLDEIDLDTHSQVNSFYRQFCGGAEILGRGLESRGPEVAPKDSGQPQFVNQGVLEYFWYQLDSLTAISFN
jgi:hypothetical protein